MAAQAILTLETWPRGRRYWFDDAEYDEGMDRLRLSYGPLTAASACPTAEGHVLRIAEPEGYLCGLVLTDVTGRLRRDGRIEVTMGPAELLELDLAEVAALLSRPGARRTNRFARRAREREQL
jgi:hypothetical protein